MKPSPIDQSGLGVVVADMDMYASGPPSTLTLDVTIERIDRFVLAKSTRSTGGDGTLLVCDRVRTREARPALTGSSAIHEARTSP